MTTIDEDVLSKVRIEPAPAVIKTRQAAREINGQHVEVLAMGYTDRIMINVTQEGKIGQLVPFTQFNLVLTEDINISLKSPADERLYRGRGRRGNDSHTLESPISPWFSD